MKRYRLLTGLMMLAVFSGCYKNDRYYRVNNNNAANTGGNAASMVGASLASDADGIVSLVANVTLNAQAMVNSRSACGTIRSDSTTSKSAAGAATTYAYTNKNKLVVLCNSSSQPDSAVNTSTYSGSFSNVNVSSTNSGSSVFYIGGVLTTLTNYTVNGTYQRSGNYQYLTGSKATTASKENLTLSNLLVSKTTRAIVGGTATFTITGSDLVNGAAAATGNYSYTGTLVFNGTNYATLTLNGIVYKVNLITGAITT